MSHGNNVENSNRAAILARRRAAYAADPERYRAKCRRWREANPEKKRAADKKWVQRNREKVNAKVRSWKKANPVKVALSGKRYRAAVVARRSAWGQLTFPIAPPPLAGAEARETTF